MSTIGGPGGVGGPKGPGGASDIDGPEELDDVGSLDSTTAARAADGLEAMASEIAAGRLAPREAVDKLVEEIAGSDALGATERAELRDLLTDLVANDPYLQSIVGRV
jgi:hypothetical protein